MVFVGEVADSATNSRLNPAGYSLVADRLAAAVGEPLRCRLAGERNSQGEPESLGLHLASWKQGQGPALAPVSVRRKLVERRQDRMLLVVRKHR